MDVVDLSRLAAIFPDGYERLRGMIAAVLEVNSCRCDLRLASDQAWQAQDLASRSTPLSTAEQDTVLALISSSIVFYVRATKSKSRHRRTIDIRSRLDPAEKVIHDELCTLRDDAFAHFGPGQLPNGATLRADFLFITDAGKLMALSRNTYADSDLVDKLARQTQRAVLILQRLFHEYEEKLVAELNRHHDNPDILGAIDAATVNLGEAIGSREMAQTILTGPRLGYQRL